MVAERGFSQALLVLTIAIGLLAVGFMPSSLGGVTVLLHGIVCVRGVPFDCRRVTLGVARTEGWLLDVREGRYGRS
jgi:hypothetical protein